MPDWEVNGEPHAFQIGAVLDQNCRWKVSIHLPTEFWLQIVGQLVVYICLLSFVALLFVPTTYLDAGIRPGNTCIVYAYVTGSCRKAFPGVYKRGLPPCRNPGVPYHFQVQYIPWFNSGRTSYFHKRGWSCVFQQLMFYFLSSSTFLTSSPNCYPETQPPCIRALAPGNSRFTTFWWQAFCSDL